MQVASDFRQGKLLRIFIDENDRSGFSPLYTAIIELLRKRGVSGATAFRGIEGYGSHERIHMAKIFSWVPNLPILIEVVEDVSVLEPLLAELQALIGEGLITLENVEYLRVSRGGEKC